MEIWIGTNFNGTAAVGNENDGVDITISSAITVGGTAQGAGNLISGNLNGVEINNSSNILVQGNMIGLDQPGTLALGNTGAGVLIDSGSSANTIGGAVAGGRNFISGNAEGIIVTGAATTGTLIAGNLIGTDVKGTSSVANSGAGIELAAGTAATIGGTTVLARNVISGNQGDGLDVDTGVIGTLIEGNYIGIDQTGADPLGNSGDGVSIDAATGTTIGGTAQNAGNVISGNTDAGLSIQSTAALVLGNRIGTDYTATTALGNGAFGILLSDAISVTIGGTSAGDQNIISGNTLGVGIGLYANTTGTLVQGNLIGTDLTGSNPLGNATGIQLDGGSSNNTIGGTTSIDGNTIAFSLGIGVYVDSSAGTGNVIRLNAIFSDTLLGIQLGNESVPANTPGGPHSGPNDLQNFPIVTALSSGGGTTTISGNLNGAPNTTFTVDFYSLSSLNASGYGEGRYYTGLGNPSRDDPAGNLQRELHRLDLRDTCRGSPVYHGDSHRSWRQHVGVLTGVRRRPGTDGPYRLYQPDGQRGRAGQL